MIVIKKCQKINGTSSNCSLTLTSSRPARRDPSHPGALLLQGPALSLPKGIPPFPPRRGSGFSRNDDSSVSSYDQLHHTACHSRLDRESRTYQKIKKPIDASRKQNQSSPNAGEVLHVYFTRS